MSILDKTIEDFKGHLKTLNRSPFTIDSYGRGIQKLIAWMEQNEFDAWRELSHERIRSFQEAFEIEALKKSYSPETKHTYLRGIKRLLEFLQTAHQLLMDPSDALEMPRLRAHRLAKEVLSENEMKKIIECCDRTCWKDIRSEAILELMYSTGLRIGEVERLDLTDIDEKGGCVRVRRGKGAKDRLVPLGRMAVAALKKYLKKVRVYHLKDPQEQAFFLTHHGKRLRRWRIHGSVKEAQERAGIAKTTSSHTLRRSFATHLLRNNAHPYYVKELLGHTNYRSMNHYIKLAGLDLRREHARTHPRERNKT